MLTDWINMMYRRAGVVLLLAMLVTQASAVQVQDLARLKGSEKSALVGMGLVVGLNGTGDGGKFAPAMRTLASAISTLIDPNTVAGELRNAKNVALVSISATLPATGVREGDRVDVHVSAVGAAKSLAGGRLFLMPLRAPRPDDDRIFAYADGAIVIEDEQSPTVGVIRGGAQLTRDVMVRNLDGGGRLTLVINEEVACWSVANNLASLINGVVSPDGPSVAMATDPKNIVVQVPEYEQRDPAAFISDIMETWIDPSQITPPARVVINERTGTIVVTGEVEISPVGFSHPGLTITTITPPAVGVPTVEQSNWLAMDPTRHGGAKLADLLTALNQLKVEAHDRIAILKEIHRSGRLHAQLVIE